MQRDSAAFVPALCRGGESSASGAAQIKGDILFRKREYPLWNPKRTRGEGPSTPDIGSLQLEELHALRIAQPLAALLPYGCGIPLAGNQVRCTWLRHESLRFETFSNRALLS